MVLAEQIVVFLTVRNFEADWTEEAETRFKDVFADQAAAHATGEDHRNVESLVFDGQAEDVSDADRCLEIGHAASRRKIDRGSGDDCHRRTGVARAQMDGDAQFKALMLPQFADLIQALLLKVLEHFCIQTLWYEF